MVRLRRVRPAMAGLLGLALLLTAVPALADSMNVSYRGNSNVTVWVDGVAQNAVTVEFYTPSAYQDALWFGYCVDPLQTFQSPIHPGDPDSWNGPEISPAVSDVNWLEVAWLMENCAPGNDWLSDPGSVDYSSDATKLAIQALQLALWEVVLEPSTTYSASDITDSSSRFYTTSSGAATLAADYLVALSEYKTLNNGNFDLSGEYQIYDSGSRQDLIVGTDTAGAPEPATMLLMASAMALGGGILRRRRKRV